MLLLILFAVHVEFMMTLAFLGEVLLVLALMLVLIWMLVFMFMVGVILGCAGVGLDIHVDVHVVLALHGTVEFPYRKRLLDKTNTVGGGGRVHVRMLVCPLASMGMGVYPCRILRVILLMLWK